ncbi:MAG: argininosuccinate lyase [Acidobacteria bacterium]|nr:argininosuccinate lyase [Acidobacteriota bacterium]
MRPKRLWGGRFAAEEDPLFAEFNASLRFDRELIEADVQGSIAYARALERAGVVTAREKARLIAGLKTILKDHHNEPARIVRSSAEDVHTYVENALAEKVGSLALKLHTGRSRNDQVATDMRLYLMARCEEIEAQLAGLLRALAAAARRCHMVILPGYTHLQGAQPVLLSHYLLAYGEMFLRDRERLRKAVERMDVCPLGSGALAGTPYRVRREALARELGFSRISENSLDAVSDRDFVIDFLHFASVLMMHFSRMAEDLIIYSSAEFGFVQMSDSVASGSSLMPQKKNPDALELVRGKTGRVYGHLMAMLSTMKGQPLAYNKDLQEDKEGLFDTIQTVTSCIPMLRRVLETMSVDPERMRAQAESGYLNATEVADYLVARNIPFREAHHAAGRIVRRAMELGVLLKDLPIDEYRRISPLFSEDVYSWLDLENLVGRRIERGGTAPRQVGEALRRFVRKIGRTTPRRSRPASRPGLQRGLRRRPDR